MSAEIKFLADFMLGRLAKSLRMLGYDAKYLSSSERRSITTVSLKERRVVLSRHTKLSPRKCWKLVFIKSDDPASQLRQVFRECNLRADKSRFFSRCTLCNDALIPVKKSEIEKKVPGYVWRNCDEFSLCRSCGHIYWKGTHYDLALERLRKEEIELI